MGHRNGKNPQLDPVAEVLLDFQSVMAQFLELQTEMLAVRRSRTVPLRSATVLPAAQVTTYEAEPARIRAEPVSAVSEPQQGEPEQLAPEKPVSQHDATLQFAQDQAAFSRYTLSVRERPLGQTKGGLAADHAIVLTDDGTGVSRLLAEKLRSTGRRVAIIAPPAIFDPGLDVYVSALDSAEEADRIARSIGAACGPVAAVIHLMPLSPPSPLEGTDTASWWGRLCLETRTLFLLAKAFGPSLDSAARSGGAALIGATSMGGAFGSGSPHPPMLPSQGGVTGFLKCVGIEWPDVRVRAVDLDPAEPVDAITAHILDELWSKDGSIEIGYFNGRRVGLDAVRTPASLDRAFALPSDAVILATGGARGITAEVCLELAERYQPTFVLVGQSPLPPAAEPPDTAALTSPSDLKKALTSRLQAAAPRVTPAMVEKAYRHLLKDREVRGVIGKLSAAGARTHYVQTDVTDEQAFGALIEDVYATYGRLDGVIHGAGIIEDKLVRDKSIESFDRVFRTKVMSAHVLSRHLKPESLRFLIFFSSVAGRFGNRGQADYAAANEVISKLAITLQRKWSTRVCAIAWAPWDKSGMVSPELKREFARRGVELLSPTAGRRALWQELQQSPWAAAEVVVGGYAATPLAVDSEPEPLPLLKNATREMTSGGSIRFARLLDPSIDGFLNDHRLDGRPVLPLAFATELMAEAAQAAWPDLKVVAVRDLQLLKGIVVDSASVSMMVTVRGAVHSGDDGLTETDVDISTPSTTPPLRYRCIVQLASRRREPQPFDAPAWPLSPLSKTLDRAYQDWTFHGPLFQRITDIAGISVDAMLGTVYSPSAAPALARIGRPEWIIDPFVFDAALQLLLMWSRAQNDKTALPSRFRSFSRFAQLSDQRLTCYVAVQSLAGGHAIKSNVHFVDAAGRVLAVLDTMEASCTNALNRLAGSDPQSHSVQ